MELKNEISHFIDLVNEDHTIFRRIVGNYGISADDYYIMRKRIHSLEKEIFNEWFKEQKKEAWIDGELRDLYEVILEKDVKKEEREEFCEKVERLMGEEELPF